MNRTLCIALCTLLASGTTSAAFYVEEGSAPQMAAPVGIKRSVSDSTFELPFYAKRGWLNPIARTQLGEHLQTLRAAEEVGLVINTGATAPALARQRVEATKLWLADNGIPESRVVVSEYSDPNAKDKADTLVVTIASSRAMPTTVPEFATERVTRRAVRSQVAATQPTQAPMNDEMKLALVQRIIVMSRASGMRPDDILTLVAEVLNMQEGARPAQGPVAAVPAPRLAPTLSPMAPQFVAMEVPQRWVLDSNKTLRANLDEWARLAGWESPSWQASNQYQVTQQATLSGSFIDALDQVSKAVPALDFAVNKARRTLRVQDAVETER